MKLKQILTESFSDLKSKIDSLIGPAELNEEYNIINTFNDTVLGERYIASVGKQPVSVAQILEWMIKNKQVSVERRDTSFWFGVLRQPNGLYMFYAHLMDEIVKAVERLEAKSSTAEERIVFRTPNILLVELLNYGASRKWCNKTRWCTFTNRKDFENYRLNDGSQFVIFLDTGFSTEMFSIHRKEDTGHYVITSQDNQVRGVGQIPQDFADVIADVDEGDVRRLIMVLRGEGERLLASIIEDAMEMSMY